MKAARGVPRTQEPPRSSSSALHRTLGGLHKAALSCLQLRLVMQCIFVEYLSDLNQGDAEAVWGQRCHE